MFGGFIFGVFVFSALMEFIYHKDIKMVLRHKLGLTVTAGAGILLISCVIFDWVGYNSWLPDRDGVEAMSVFSDSGLGSNVYQVHTEKNDGEVDEYRSYLERMMEKETTDFDSIYELAEEAVATNSRYEEGRTVVYVKYALKNGKKAYRRYWIPEGNYKKLEDNLYQEEWYREMCYPILSNDHMDDQGRLMRIEIGTWSGETTTLSGKEAEELYKVYREELGNMTVAELRGDEEKGENDSDEGAEAEEQIWDQMTDFYFIFSDKDGNYNQESGYPFGKNFKMTINLLKKEL